MAAGRFGNSYKHLPGRDSIAWGSTGEDFEIACWRKSKYQQVLANVTSKANVKMTLNKTSKK